MRRLQEIWAQPIPAEQSLIVFAVAAVVLLLAATTLIAIPGPGAETNDSAVVTVVPTKPDPVRELEAAVKTTARRFMVGYMPLASGHADPARLEAAAPKLLRRLGRPVRVPPAARHRHPRVVEVDSGPVSAGQATAAVTVASGGLTFPVILELELVGGRWLVTRVGAE